MLKPHFFVLKHGAIQPYHTGMKARLAATRLPCVVVGQCDCTSPLLHYLIRLDSGATMTAQHPELEKVD